LNFVTVTVQAVSAITPVGSAAAIIAAKMLRKIFVFFVVSLRHNPSNRRKGMIASKYPSAAATGDRLPS